MVVGYNIGFHKDVETTSMSPESIFEYGKCLAKLSDNVDALFIGCSGFRATGTRLMISKVTVCNQVLFYLRAYVIEIHYFTIDSSLGYGFIDRLEKAIGKPVITSNQAVMWYCLKMCENVSVDDLLSVKGYGQLFSISQ